MVKKFWLIVFILLCCTASIKAEDCKIITYYSKQSYVKREKLLDQQFSSNNPRFTTNDGLFVELNILGTFNTHQAIDSMYFNHVPYKISNHDFNHPRFIDLTFSKPIKINNLTFEILNEQKNTQSLQNIKIEINGYYRNGVYLQGKQIYLHNSQQKQSISVKDQVANIHFSFGKPNRNSEITLKYLQIEQYEILKHQAWVQDYIPNTNTFNYYVCNNQGIFQNNGTNGIWYQQADTYFSPTVDVVNDYQPHQESVKYIFDYGKGNYINYYGSLDLIKNINEHARKIKYFQQVGQGDHRYYQAYDAQDQLIIPITNSENGVKYVVRPVYWHQRMNSSRYLGVTSNNENWCKHVTGSRSTPCHKHQGHQSNRRYNCFDVIMYHYSNVIVADLQAIDYVKYEITNLINHETKVIYGDENIWNYTFNETGKYQVKATIYDLAHGYQSITSKIFYIDNLPPTINYVYDEDNYCLELQVTDDHSKIQDYVYSLLLDGKIIFTSEKLTSSTTIKFSQSGEYQVICYAKDWANNEAAKTSDKYQISFNLLDVEKIITPTYDPNKQNQSYIHLKPLKDITKGTIQIYQEEDLLKEDNFDLAVSEHLVIPYTLNNLVDTDLIYIITLGNDQKIIQHPLHLITQQQNEINLAKEQQDIAATMYFNNQESMLYEKSRFNLLGINDCIISGYGVDLKLKLEYLNECGEIKNTNCHFTLTPIYQQANIKFSEGVKLKNNKSYLEQLETVNFNDLLELPEVFMNRKTGEICTKNDQNAIFGYRRWYTNPLSAPNKYPYLINLHRWGVNKNNFLIKGDYLITQSFKDTIKLRYVDPTNPFPNNNQNIWRGHEAYFNF